MLLCQMCCDVIGVDELKKRYFPNPKRIEKVVPILPCQGCNSDVYCVYDLWPRITVKKKGGVLNVVDHSRKT